MMKVSPECWIGTRLSWACQCHWLMVVGRNLLNCDWRELWNTTSNRLWHKVSIRHSQCIVLLECVCGLFFCVYKCILKRHKPQNLHLDARHLKLDGSTFHLKKGIGALCAGQTKLKGEPCFVLKEPKVSELVENFGDDVPTGSRNIFLGHDLSSGIGLWAVNLCCGGGRWMFHPSDNDKVTLYTPYYPDKAWLCRNMRHQQSFAVPTTWPLILWTMADWQMGLTWKMVQVTPGQDSSNYVRWDVQ